MFFSSLLIVNLVNELVLSTDLSGSGEPAAADTVASLSSALVFSSAPGDKREPEGTVVMKLDSLELGVPPVSVATLVSPAPLPSFDSLSSASESVSATSSAVLVV